MLSVAAAGGGTVPGTGTVADAGAGGVVTNGVPTFVLLCAYKKIRFEAIMWNLAQQ